jgi:hypothetical protein
LIPTVEIHIVGTGRLITLSGLVLLRLASRNGPLMIEY